MEFLKSCANSLDEGEDGEVVLARLRERYTTPQSLNSKASLVRKLCEKEESKKKLKVPRLDMKACKRASARAALLKNRTMKRVDGRKLLARARSIVSTDAPLDQLVLALILLSGRRMVEVLAASTTTAVRVVGRYTLAFGGQAKTKHERVYEIPVLHDAAVVSEAFARVSLQVVPRHDPELTERQLLSRSYQSWLGRALHADPVFAQAGRVHALRAIYACMCVRLFEWNEDFSPAYIAMSVLGHASLSESLVYTPYTLGDDFGAEPSLGAHSLGAPAKPQDVADDAPVVEGAGDDGLGVRVEGGDLVEQPAHEVGGDVEALDDLV